MNTPLKEMQYWITLEPVGRRVEVSSDTSVLEAAQKAGIDLLAVCGGNGSCGMCKVLPIFGNFSSLSNSEQKQLQPTEKKTGMRLACHTRILSDCTVQFPPESLSTLQRLQLEGTQNIVSLHPAVQWAEITLTPALQSDIKTEVERVQEALNKKKYLQIHISPELNPVLLKSLQEHKGTISLVWNQLELITALPPGRRLFGFAVDIGTTKVAGYLVDLQTGQTMASGGITNPQIAYGEDVISRIKYADEHSQGSEVLQMILIQAINALLTDLCRQAGATLDQVVDSVMVGNTVMHHLLAGLPVHSLGTAPYVASMIRSMNFPAREIGLTLADGAFVYLPPNIAGFVGSDHVAMLLATRAAKQKKTVAALDIGTNTEISLIHKGRHYTCSCASGPAFEGAHIRDGLRAIPGAIERVHLEKNSIQLQTIDGKPAIGICGSGILDTVAGLRKENLIDARGSFIKEDTRLKVRDGKYEFVLITAQDSGLGREIGLNRKDINEIQLAKAAIRSGIEVLMEEAQICAADINLFFVAGAFGSYLDLNNAIQIGMFPRLPLERFRQVGNAAGAGAREMLLSTFKRREAEKLIEKIEYVELTTVSNYSDIFMNAIGLE
ncbi:MAG: ferredoxin [Anaerolinea sp.]|nr:ferredoxin [Anaerolinea sp.]